MEILSVLFFLGESLARLLLRLLTEAVRITPLTILGYILLLDTIYSAAVVLFLLAMLSGIIETMLDSDSKIPYTE